MYQIIEYEGKFAVQNMNDETILKSKDSGKIISFSDKSKAENLRQVCQNHYDMISEAGKTWWIKEATTGKNFVMRKIII